MGAVSDRKVSFPRKAAYLISANSYKFQSLSSKTFGSFILMGISHFECHLFDSPAIYSVHNRVRMKSHVSTEGSND